MYRNCVGGVGEPGCRVSMYKGPVVRESPQRKREKAQMGGPQEVREHVGEGEAVKVGSPLRPYGIKNKIWVLTPKSKGKPSGGFKSRNAMCYPCFPPIRPCPDILVYSGQLKMLATVSLPGDFLRPQKQALLACGAGRGARGLTAFPRLQSSPTSPPTTPEQPPAL